MGLKYLTLTDPSNPARPRHMAYYEWGDSSNPRVAVCVHGLSRNGHDFDRLAEALAPHFRVLCPDMAGRGKSDWLERKSDYNYLTYCTDVTALCEQLRLKDVAFIGTSMGGIIGMMLAAGQPGRIERLVLNDIGSIVSAAGLTRILNYVGSSGVFAGADEAMAHLKSILAPFGISSEADWQHMFAISFNPLPDGRYAFAYDPDINLPFREAVSKEGAITDVDLSAIWNAVACPALVLRGEQSDILTHATAQSMCARAIPTQLVEFKHVGHAPTLLDSEQIQVILDWLGIHKIGSAS